MFEVFDPVTDEDIKNAEILGYIGTTRVFQLFTDSRGVASWNGTLPSATGNLSISTIFPDNYVFVAAYATDANWERPLNISPLPNGTFTLAASDLRPTAGIPAEIFIWLLAEQEPQPPHPFTDVPEGAWFHDAVEFVYTEGIMRGTSATTFEPMTNFSREMVVGTLFRMYHGRPANASDPTTTPFADVRTGAWYAPYISWAFSQSLVMGINPTTFGVGSPVTRQDFATLMYRFANFTGADTSIPSDFTPDFPDADSVGSWAEDAIAWAVYTGLIGGTDRNELLPWGSAVRAEAATILMRYIQTVAE